MRKYLCVLISIILCLTVFCACSNGKTANVAGSTNITSSTSSEQTTDTEEVTVTANEVQTTQKKDKKTSEKGEKASIAAKSVSKKDKKSRTASQKVILNQKAIQKLKRSILKKKSLPQTLRAKSRKQLCKKRMTIRLLKPPRLRLIAQSRLNVSPFSIIWTT